MSVAPAPLQTDSAPCLVLDACVLMSSILRPLLLDFAEAGFFRPVWSERIGQEWQRNAARIWKKPPTALAQMWETMQSRFPDACMNALEPYESVLRYSDPKDFHVVAAGLACKARLIGQAPVAVLTWNLKDFNKGELRRQGLQVLDPDRLFGAWMQDAPEKTRALAERATGYATLLGRDEPLVETLRRERLFRCAKLLQTR